MRNNESLRDAFAAMAMKYFLDNTTDREAVRAGMEWEEIVAVQSYIMADAMMEERKQK
jgi:hypothetical protein